MFVENLLQQINLLLFQEKERQKAKTERGENFNAFKVIGLSREEVRFHSAFLSELLNPQGSHGLKDVFLKAFLHEVINDEEFLFETTSARTVSEHLIDCIDETSERGGRIDILISNDDNQAIIIENKIDARDQEKQLLRYHNFGNDLGGEFKLLYLNIDGSMPNEISKGNRLFNFSVISYNDHIINWLQRCVELSACYPAVRESIRQYILTLKDICNIMDNQNEMLNVLTSKSNIEATLEIIEKRNEIHYKVREDFGNQLKIIANTYGWEAKTDDGVFKCEDDKWIRFSKKDCFDKWYIAIGVYNHTNSDGYRFGIRVFEKSVQYLGEKYWESEPSSEWPFGWGYLRGKINGRFWRWDDSNTLRAMANGELAKYIDEELFKKIIKRNLIEELEKLIIV